ncbi:MAG: hypothetical protein ACYCPT_06410 [Acidimicrobiales bacterium]
METPFGKDGASAVGTLVVRQTRRLLLLHLADDHGAEALVAAMRDATCSPPSELVRSVIWIKTGSGLPLRCRDCRGETMEPRYGDL